MSKPIVIRLFVAAIVAVVAGLVVGFAAIVAAFVGGAVAVGGPDIVTVNGEAFAGIVVWLVIASVATAAGGLAALASWIGALFNTAQLNDKTWFVVLLVLGLFSFGWLAMVAYVIAGPDSTEQRGARAGVSTAAGI
jgi:hypothetical protein